VEGDLTANNFIVGSTNLITEITALQGRLDIEEPKTSALQTLTANHSDDIASNTGNILTKQDLVTSSTNLTANSITLTDLNVHGAVDIDPNPYFDTIVIRRPTGFSGDATYYLGVRELQCWVNNSNILFDNANDLISYYALWSDKETAVGLIGTTSLIYDNNIPNDYQAMDTVSSSDIALIIKNIPSTSIDSIQSIIFYARTGNQKTNQGLSIELYKSVDFTNILANTDEITKRRETYRFDFHTIDTYTGGFSSESSITQIISEGATTNVEESNFISLNAQIKCDVVTSGSITANNFIVGSTNLITEINTKQDLITDGSLTIARTDGLQTALTALQDDSASNTADIDSNTADILTKQDLITTLTDFETNSITTNNLEVNGGLRIDTSIYLDTIVIRRLNEADNNTFINLNELQVWVNGSNILFPNSSYLTSFFAKWANKQIDLGSSGRNSPVSNLYNNIIEADYGSHSGSGANALIIKNIPLTSINEIQAIVLYNRKTSSNRILGLLLELYNSTNDPDFTEVLANTNVISQSGLTYRYDFPSIDTYTGFVGEDSITNIVNNTFALTEEANFTPLFTELTGDVVVGGDLTLDGVNINTT